MAESRNLALITGGSSGIGFGAALKLAPTHDLALSFAQNEIKAKKALHHIKDKYPNCEVEIFQKPLFKHEDCVALYESVQKHFQQDPLVLVNCAGRIRDSLFLGSDFSEHLDLINEHLIVSMSLSHLAVKSMYRKRFGRILNMSSISAHYSKRGQSSYAAAKAGLEGFTRTLALEVAHRGVTVNAIAPGLIETPMTEKLLEKLKAKNKNLSSRIPAGRAGSAEEVGALIAFLASQEAAYITGTVQVIDGGRSLGDSAS
ncbi:SDR family oxidoreductase [bacterium]|nr:SDR family oxidoreductase [bacterium]